MITAYSRTSINSTIRLMSTRIYQIFDRNKPLFGLMIWLAIVPLLTSTSLTVFFVQNAECIKDFSVVEWTFFFSLSVITMTFAFTPTTYVCLVSGYFLGMESAVFLVLAYQLASSIGFLLTRYFDQELFTELIARLEKGDTIQKNIHKSDFILTMLCRLSPALPFALMNVALSIAQVRFSSFFWGGLIGMLPRTIFFLWVGSQAAKLENAFDHQEDLTWIIGLTLVVFVAIFFLLRPLRKTR